MTTSSGDASVRCGAFPSGPLRRRSVRTCQGKEDAYPEKTERPLQSRFHDKSLPSPNGPPSTQWTGGVSAASAIDSRRSSVSSFLPFSFNAHRRRQPEAMLRTPSQKIQMVLLSVTKRRRHPHRSRSLRALSGSASQLRSASFPCPPLGFHPGKHRSEEGNRFAIFGARPPCGKAA
jgi:hypothetical protein